MGHRVVGHEGKCKNFHGHNYRVHFFVNAESLDLVGRVIDFSVIKSVLCEWLERNWDHRMMLWEQDPSAAELMKQDSEVFTVPFNPTAENIAAFFCEEIAPALLEPLGVELVKMIIEETRKCSVEYCK
jgi:6-pyruvoyltetrahydropterin/6-carboxytetrahydropterin synthase